MTISVEPRKIIRSLDLKSVRVRVLEIGLEGIAVDETLIGTQKERCNSDMKVAARGENGAEGKVIKISTRVVGINEGYRFTQCE